MTTDYKPTHPSPLLSAIRAIRLRKTKTKSAKRNSNTTTKEDGDEQSALPMMERKTLRSDGCKNMKINQIMGKQRFFLWLQRMADFE